MAASSGAATRRQKIILAGGGALLAALVALQLPRLLGGGETSTEGTPPSTTLATPTSSGTTAPPTVPATLAALGDSDRSPKPGRSQLAAFDRFEATQPFFSKESFAALAPVVKEITSSSTPLGVLLGSDELVTYRPGPGSEPAPMQRPTIPLLGRSVRGYVVILRSIPVRAGLRRAQREARQVQRSGLRVRVLLSSRYSTLRPGYYIVVTGAFRTYVAARVARTQARSRGFDRAYARRLRP
ncbi:MAG: hypothetical protein H0V40_06490 [Actinobacteria bacterium]|nr:hypothetical protein [Actinomycetota bacterium]